MMSAMRSVVSSAMRVPFAVGHVLLIALNGGPCLGLGRIVEAVHVGLILHLSGLGLRLGGSFVSGALSHDHRAIAQRSSHLGLGEPS